MTPHLLRKLSARNAAICERWEALLRIEPVRTPLANPDALVHLIRTTVSEILRAAAKLPASPVRSLKSVQSVRLPTCECGNNPYLAYFIAGEQAMVETLVLLQAELPPSDRLEADVADVIHVVRETARGEIEAFCGLCTHRCAAPQCRHAVAVS